MTDLSNKTALIYDASGGFTHVAEAIAPSFGNVLYYSFYERGFPDVKDYLPGMGLDGIERVDDFDDALAHADICCFLDVSRPGLQERLRKEGMPVWGAGRGSKLEQDREVLKAVLKECGLPVSPWRPVDGLDELREVLREKDDLWVKMSMWRSCLETYHHLSYFASQTWLDDLGVRLGPFQNSARFIVEEPIAGDACEVGLDGFQAAGKLLTPTLWGYEVKDCYDVETEVLTDSGWKFFKDLDGSEQVLTLKIEDPGHYRIEYQSPTRYIRDTYKGPMLSIQNRNVDLLVTPNHNLFMQVNEQDPKRKRVTWKFGDGERSFHLGTHNRRLVRASSVNIEKPFSMPHPRSAFFHSRVKRQQQTFRFGKLRMNGRTFAKVLGLYLSEGSVAKGYITISQFKYCKQFGAILEPLGFRKIKSGFGLYNKELAAYLSQFGKAGDKYVPQWIKDSSYILIREFLHCYCLGDGSFLPNERNGGTRIYVTKSHKMADDLQELLIKAGSVAIVRRQSSRAMYTISERVVNTKNYVLPGQATWTEYSGEIFCVTVPNHIIMVRRHGKPIWCGNSSYLGTTAVVPERLMDCYEKLQPVLEAINYCGPFSVEVRMTGEDAYVIDWTSRCPSPPSEAQCVVIENLAEIIWEGAHGNVVTPKYRAPYVAQLVLRSTWGMEHALGLDIGRPDRVCIHGHCRIDGNDYAVSPAEIEECGGAVGYGSTVAEAIEDCFDAADSVKGYQVHFSSGALNEAIECIRNGESVGLPWGRMAEAA